jgi:hypothetical protein
MPLSSYPRGGTLMPKPTLFVVTDELQQVLAELPQVGPRSRLEPLRTFILRWRRDGRSYRDIRDILASKCKVTASHEAVRKFVKLHAKPRKPQTESETEPLSPATQPQSPLPPAPSNANLPTDAARNLPTLQSFRNKPALEPKPAVLVEFHYDEDKPLTIDRTIKD